MYFWKGYIDLLIAVVFSEVENIIQHSNTLAFSINAKEEFLNSFCDTIFFFYIHHSHFTIVFIHKKWSIGELFGCKWEKTYLKKYCWLEVIITYNRKAAGTKKIYNAVCIYGRIPTRLRRKWAISHSYCQTDFSNKKTHAAGKYAPPF